MQGDAVVRVRGTDDDVARVAAFGVDSADPAVARQRATRLLATARPDGTVAAPDGTAIAFTEAGASAGEPGLLTGIDHVSLAAPYDDVDRTALFYHGVLGLEPGPEVEFAAPFGLVRGLFASDSRGLVRIAHNVSTLRRGEWAPAVPDPQHIAFTTADAIATAHAMRARGCALLEIPDNYYDDLDARLAPPRLAELRASVRPVRPRRQGRRVAALRHPHSRWPGVLRGGATDRRLRRIWRGQLAGADGGAPRATRPAGVPGMRLFSPL